MNDRAEASRCFASSLCLKRSQRPCPARPDPARRVSSRDGEAELEGVGTVVLVGNAGPAMWEAFAPHIDVEPNPLDRWTKRVVDPIAEEFGARAVYPFGEPRRPFQRWALRAETLYSSPLGILIHPEYGLWHAWRAALLFAERLDLPPRSDAPSPCESCAEKPCLSACPVGAFTGSAYDVPACAAHIAKPEADCLAVGCHARNACPVGPRMALRRGADALPHGGIRPLGRPQSSAQPRRSLRQCRYNSASSSACQEVSHAGERKGRTGRHRLSAADPAVGARSSAAFSTGAFRSRIISRRAALAARRHRRRALRARHRDGASWRSAPSSAIGTNVNPFRPALALAGTGIFAPVAQSDVRGNEPGAPRRSSSSSALEWTFVLFVSEQLRSSLRRGAARRALSGTEVRRGLPQLQANVPRYGIRL